LVSYIEEHRLNVFENRELRKIFGPKRYEVTREWRRLHDEELCNLYSPPNIIWVQNQDEMGGPCSTYGEGEARGKQTTWKT
jgi:hypothetical protein